MDFFCRTLKLKTIEDFQSLFSKAEEVEPLLSKVKDLECVPLQVSRVRQAWRGVCEAKELASSIKRKGDEQDDLDALLPTQQLDDLKDKFWNRHHIKWHPMLEPSDYWVSKCVKKLQKRLLSVDDIWSVRSLQHQAKTDRKRQKIPGTELEITSSETADVSVQRNVHSYLQCLFTYCVAWARAGCDLRNDAPETETRATESIRVVQVPLDVILSYHDRAYRQMNKLLVYFDDARALKWLIAKDEEDRSKWVEVFRHSDKSLGEIVKETMDQREASWILPERPTYPSTVAERTRGGNVPIQPAGWSPQGASPPAKGGGGRGGKGSRNQQKRGGKDATHGTGSNEPPSVERRADGKPLCDAWNRGKCTETPCPKGEMHACNRRLRGGKACGMGNHTLYECHNWRAE